MELFITDQTQEATEWKIHSKCTLQRQGNTMWLGNVALWNQYTVSTGDEICTRNKDKTLHGQNISQR